MVPVSTPFWDSDSIHLIPWLDALRIHIYAISGDFQTLLEHGFVTVKGKVVVYNAEDAATIEKRLFSTGPREPNPHSWSNPFPPSNPSKSKLSDIAPAAPVRVADEQAAAATAAAAVAKRMADEQATFDKQMADEQAVAAERITVMAAASFRATLAACNSPTASEACSDDDDWAPPHVQHRPLAGGTPVLVSGEPPRWGPSVIDPVPADLPATSAASTPLADFTAATPPPPPPPPVATTVAAPHGPPPLPPAAREPPEPNPWRYLDYLSRCMSATTILLAAAIALAPTLVRIFHPPLDTTSVFDLGGETARDANPPATSLLHSPLSAAMALAATVLALISLFSYVRRLKVRLSAPSSTICHVPGRGRAPGCLECSSSANLTTTTSTLPGEAPRTTGTSVLPGQIPPTERVTPSTIARSSAAASSAPVFWFSVPTFGAEPPPDAAPPWRPPASSPPPAHTGARALVSNYYLRKRGGGNRHPPPASANAARTPRANSFEAIVDSGCTWHVHPV